MVLRMNKKLAIDNVRNYPAETVEQLRRLLAAGALAHADPHRDNFYELENGSRAFYIHVYGDKVLLLAAWPKRAAANA
ncbi:MAG: hypothetical protein V3R29_03525 [Candidatus Acidoferrales bacterium]|nr:hypothetical protein [Acidobacteriia bacterium AH_259_A11_L15]